MFHLLTLQNKTFDVFLLTSNNELRLTYLKVLFNIENTIFSFFCGHEIFRLQIHMFASVCFYSIGPRTAAKLVETFLAEERVLSFYFGVSAWVDPCESKKPEALSPTQ